MGFLHKLWDETLAGPPPETGLGKLRKHDSFSASRSPPMVIPHDDHQVPVTRSITILRTSSHLKNLSADSGSAPGSPSGSSTPGTPHSRGSRIYKWMMGFVLCILGLVVLLVGFDQPSQPRIGPSVPLLISPAQGLSLSSQKSSPPV
ncbi:hypothetical protein RGQ29_021594 [Quercus rubra]|uniref:Uncharacterized protein n=1 Tax=Quercus rubra TaxID=3512 RepID=A0AAN7FF19_QUERU|nr:hypothetical protein RGQ29_021594 [Quercus rubra]